MKITNQVLAERIDHVIEKVDDIRETNKSQSKRIGSLEKFQERLKGMYGAFIIIGAGIGALIGWIISLFGGNK